MACSARVLVVAATAPELASSDGWRSLQCGIGPVEAAIATYRAIAAERPPAILHVGVAGARRDANLTPATLVIGSESHYVDLRVPANWAPAMIPASPLLLSGVQRAFPDLRVLPIATSASVGGLLRAYGESCHSCTVEAMEGFGVLRAAQLAGVPALELRAISNEVEEKDRGLWHLDAAMEALVSATPKLVATIDAILKGRLANHEAHA